MDEYIHDFESIITYQKIAIPVGKLEVSYKKYEYTSVEHERWKYSMECQDLCYMEGLLAEMSDEFCDLQNYYSDSTNDIEEIQSDILNGLL